jgi:hypothetical protein
MMGAGMAPPIIPGRTQIAPGAMRALLRNQPDDDEMGMEDQQEAPQSEQGLLADFGNLFWKAGEYPGLQDVMLSFVKALKKASDQRNIVSTQSTLRMPVPTMMPQALPEESAPQGDLLSALLGGA